MGDFDWEGAATKVGQLEVKGSNGAKTHKYIEYSILQYSIVQSIGLIYYI